MRVTNRSGEQHESRLHCACSRQRDRPCYTCWNIRGLQIVYKTQVNGTHHGLCAAVDSPQGCCIFTDWLLGNRKSGLVWKEYQFTKMKRSWHQSGVQWCQLLWKASFFFWGGGGFTCCWLGLLFLQSNHFISEGSRKKKINSMANHEQCLIRATKWSPARFYTGCVTLRLCARLEEVAGVMNKEEELEGKNTDYVEVLFTQGEVKEPGEFISHSAHVNALGSSVTSPYKLHGLKIAFGFPHLRH